MILGWLFPATALAVVGFFTLFAAERSSGRLRTIGNVLGIWLFVLAVLVIVGGVFVAATGRGRWDGRMGYYHDEMMQRYHPGWTQPTAPEPAPAPAPATAPPASQPK